MSQVMDDAGIQGAQQVVDLLEAYADARLSPRGAVLARMRRHVMAEAAARAAAEDAKLEAAIAAATPKRSWFATHHLQRRLAGLGMAAAMTFATSAAVLAAPPGSPFYNARVTIEQALLPSGLDDRVAAHERLLAERLREAQDAADAGNVGALQAALTAYQSEIDAAVAEVGYDPELLAFLEGALNKHTALLEKLIARLPDHAQAAEAIQRAIAASEKAAKQLHDTGRPPWAGQPGEHATPPPANGGDNQGGENGNGRGGSEDRQR